MTSPIDFLVTFLHLHWIWWSHLHSLNRVPYVEASRLYQWTYKITICDNMVQMVKTEKNKINSFYTI